MLFRPLPLLLVALLFGVWSCSTDIDLNADYKEIPIIYGLLDAQDSVHYIRIQKAFLGEQNAEVTAQNPDSIYYEQKLDVTIEARNEFGDPVGDGKKYELKRVNGATVGLDKDEGVFADEPHELYRFKAKLDTSAIYHLKMVNPETGKTITADTRLVQNFQVLRPTPAPGINLRFLPETTEDFLWNSAPNGKVTEVIMRFRYLEWDVTKPNSRELKQKDWQVFNRVVTDSRQGQHDLAKQGNAFFAFVSNNLEANPNLRRVVDTMQFIFNVGTKDLYDFVRIGEAQTGITQLQINQDYTNLNGDGLGLFSSVFSKTVNNISLAESTIDSLACSRFTRDLNFQDSEGSFPCVEE